MAAVGRSARAASKLEGLPSLGRTASSTNSHFASKQIALSAQLLKTVRLLSTNNTGRYGWFAPKLTPQQLRNLTTAESSRNLLAHMETTANNNPSSATAQNAFYQALLRANLPEIVAERYQTGRYATNAACEAAYYRALDRLGAADKAGVMASEVNSARAADMQAVAQSVAANMRGGRVAIEKGRSGPGERANPMYVVVEESYGAILFKWVKMLLGFGLTLYFAMVAIQIVIEMFGGMRKVGSSQQMQAEAKHQTVRFSDVHGCDEAKDDLQEVVEFLKNPDKFNTLGGKLPKGVLLVGPPGTGKTMLARAVAGEAGVPFFFMSGSEFDEVYVGVGAKRVRELFNAARAKSPSIVFIDELDAIGGKRNERDHAYAKQTLNQLLVDLDGFAQNSGVVFLAATNFPQLLDPALTRPGRFDRHVIVPLPDVRGRAAILKHHLRNIQSNPEVDPTVIARGTPGFSGAQLENIVNSAAIHASRFGKKEVSMKDLDWAKDKILLGAERGSTFMPPHEKLMTAYHEGGHTLVAMFTKGATPLYKVTVMPRGMALGVTHMLEEMDKHSRSKMEFLASLDVCMGGKIAEEIIYGDGGVTSGASSDISNATQIARAMVTQFGFSPALGNVDLAGNYNSLSAETKAMIDSEVRRLTTESYNRAMQLLKSKKLELERLAKALMEYETLDKTEVEKVIKGESLEGREKVDVTAPMLIPVGIPQHDGTEVGLGGVAPPPGSLHPPSPAGAGVGQGQEDLVGGAAGAGPGGRRPYPGSSKAAKSVQERE